MDHWVWQQVVILPLHYIHNTDCAIINFDCTVFTFLSRLFSPHYCFYYYYIILLNNQCMWDMLIYAYGGPWLTHPVSCATQSSKYKKKAHLHDLISCAETFLLCCTVLLNASDKDANIISSCQPQTHTVAFLESHHHCVRPGHWKKEVWRKRCVCTI